MATLAAHTHAHLVAFHYSGYVREDVLKDGDKTARVHPSRGVKQGCPLSPLLFSLYVNDVDELQRCCYWHATVLCDAHAVC